MEPELEVQAVTDRRDLPELREEPELPDLQGQRELQESLVLLDLLVQQEQLG